VDVDDLDDFARGLIDLIVAVFLVLIVLVDSSGYLRLIVAVGAYHVLKVLVRGVRVDQKFVSIQIVANQRSALSNTVQKGLVLIVVRLLLFLSAVSLRLRRVELGKAILIVLSHNENLD